MKWEKHQSEFEVTSVYARPTAVGRVNGPGPAKVNDRAYFMYDDYPEVQARFFDLSRLTSPVTGPVHRSAFRTVTGEFYLITSEDGVDYYMTLDKVDSVLKSPIQRKALPDRFLDAFEYLDEV